MGSVDVSFERTREALHRVAAHVLARRRWDATGHFGLRVSPGGIATPAFGDDTEWVRITGTLLVRDSAGVAAFTSIQGSSLRALARFAGTDIESPFSCGDDAPEVGDPDQPLEVSEQHVQTIFQWYDLGWRVMDTVLGALPPSGAPVPLQLWPEHFDIGTNVGVGDERVNLGCSPGDRYESEPYLYVGPWGTERPGEPSYWNASFGAVLKSSQIIVSANPLDSGVRFMMTGLDALSTKVPTR